MAAGRRGGRSAAAASRACCLPRALEPPPARSGSWHPQRARRRPPTRPSTGTWPWRCRRPPPGVLWSSQQLLEVVVEEQPVRVEAVAYRAEARELGERTLDLRTVEVVHLAPVRPRLERHEGLVDRPEEHLSIGVVVGDQRDGDAVTAALP